MQVVFLDRAALGPNWSRDDSQSLGLGRVPSSLNNIQFSIGLAPIHVSGPVCVLRNWIHKPVSFRMKMSSTQLDQA